MRSAGAGLWLLVTAAVVAQERDLKFQRITSLPSMEKRWALLVGVDRYEDEQISPLRGAANDASALKRVLIDYCGFPENNVVVLASDQLETRKPKRGTILQRLDNVLRLVPKDGLFLFSFSGHGVEWDNRAYLMPADARLASSRRLLEDVALDVQRLRTAIEERGIQQVVVLLDACRNDPGGRADTTNPLTASFVNGLTFNARNRDIQAFATLYATSVGDRSWEYIEKQQGYFTWFVTEGLKGRAANERGEVTLQSLLNYVEERVPRQVALDLGEKGRQRPFARVEGFRADHLVLSTTPAVVRQPSAVDEEAEYWGLCREQRGRFCQIYLERYPQGRFAQLVKVIRNSPAETPGPGMPENVSAVRDSDLSASAVLENPKDGQKYVSIPSGSFKMGCSEGDSFCLDNEKPTHLVKIAQSFWIGQTEVTQEAFQQVMGRTVSHFQGVRLPAESVTWTEAATYCQKVGGRLPTEAEWEYAARGGNGSERYGELGAIAWYGGNSGGKVHEVGQRAPNRWGLYDMLGNVWEWTADWYSESYYRISPASDPQGPTGGKYRVLRGGAWDNLYGKVFRTSNRNKDDPEIRYVNIGFRCILQSP